MSVNDAILKLPAPVRHALAAAGSVVLAEAGTVWIPGLENQSNVIGATLAAACWVLLAWLTPLVSSYGVGATRARELGARTPADGPRAVPGEFTR